MIRVGRLPGERWADFRGLRLEALQKEPVAFGSSYEEELVLGEEEWRRRIKNVFFAVEGGTPVGMTSLVFGDRIKTRHIAHIFSVYVRPDRRGLGLGKKMLDRALAEARRRRRVVKVQLSVNPSAKAAVALYKRAGFKVTGRAHKELKVGNRYHDLLYMELQVGRRKMRAKRTSSIP